LFFHRFLPVPVFYDGSQENTLKPKKIEKSAEIKGKMGLVLEETFRQPLQG
jgi:hypothetical protein